MTRLFAIFLAVIVGLMACDDGGEVDQRQPTELRQPTARDAAIESCDRNRSCPNGQECVLGRCGPAMIPGANDSDTVAGMMTSGGSSSALSAGLALSETGGNANAPTAGIPVANMESEGGRTGGAAQGGSMTRECSRDFDCSVGNRCRDGTCVPRDPMVMGGMAMPGGGVQGGGPCMVTADCPDDLFCDDGTCVVCRRDTDCIDGQRCEAGACEMLPPECRVNEDCRGDGGQRCVDGTCTPDRCFGSTQCPNGQRCVRGTCYAGESGDGSGTCQRPTPLVVGEIARGRPQGGERHSGSCSISPERSGTEAVFALTPDFTDAVCLTTAWYAYAGFIPDLYVRRSVCDSQMEMGCAQSNGEQYLNLLNADTQAVLEIEVEAGQTYFVFVDARTGLDADDAYILSAQRGTCNAISLPTACDETIHAELGQPIDGNSKFGSRAFEGSCAGFGDDGDEQVVHFRSGANGGPVCVRVDPEAAGNTRVLYVRKSSCADGPEVACADERQVADRKVSVLTEADTDYFVFVDSLTSGSAYRLIIEDGACP